MVFVMLASSSPFLPLYVLRDLLSQPADMLSTTIQTLGPQATPLSCQQFQGWVLAETLQLLAISPSHLFFIPLNFRFLGVSPLVCLYFLLESPLLIVSSNVLSNTSFPSFLYRRTRGCRWLTTARPSH